MNDGKSYTAEELIGFAIKHLEVGREQLLESDCPKCEGRTVVVDLQLMKVEECLRRAMGCMTASAPRKSDPS